MKHMVISETPPAWRRRPATRLAVSGLAAGVFVWTTGLGTMGAQAALPAEGYADLVEQVSPAVVYISTTRKTVQMSGNEGFPFNHPFPPGSPFEEFFKRFGERMPQSPQRQRPMTALGSGFVVSADGYVVTNNHVVENADEVNVTFADNREFDAEVVGTDPQTDLALLKLEADEPLPYVSWGNSDPLRPGDVVIAVGNPFGLGGSVTAGIVSARGRNIHAGPYDDFIQTDAAINRGNSGGPMFNTQGEVVGVNTAIYSPSGGNVGIGFAIPANMAKSVVEQLKSTGNVERGWLGVKIQKVTDDIADAVGMDRAAGALITEVIDDGPASEAGFQQGDVIVSFNDQRVGEMHDLPRLVAGTTAGSTVDVDVWRDGGTKTLKVDIGRLDPEQVASLRDDGGDGNGPAHDSNKLGAQLSRLDAEMRERLDLDETVGGVVITALEPDGLAARQGLRVGDVIRRVGSKTVDKPADVESALNEADKQSVLLLVNRRGNEMFIGLKLTA